MTSATTPSGMREVLQQAVEALREIASRPNSDPLSVVTARHALAAAESALQKQPEPEVQPAHSKSEYKRRVALGDANVQPPVLHQQEVPSGWSGICTLEQNGEQRCGKQCSLCVDGTPARQQEEKQEGGA
jgi:hypothetical protein